jgi:hypothetical protein
VGVPVGGAGAAVVTGKAEEAPTHAARSGAGTTAEVSAGGGGGVAAKGGVKEAPTPAACPAALTVGSAKWTTGKDADPARASWAATKAAARASAARAADARAAAPAGGVEGASTLAAGHAPTAREGAEMSEVAEAP